MPKLFITNDWFINVDKNGYCADQWAEGALGFIIELKNDTGKSLALKVPRLLADTDAENAHTNKLMETEVANVFDLEPLDPLMRAELANQMLLRHELTIKREDAQDTMPAALFMSVERDKPPRFCLVTCSADAVSTTPQIAELESLLSKGNFGVLRDESKQWTRTVFISKTKTAVDDQSAPPKVPRAEPHGATVGNLAHHLRSPDRPPRWYAGLPGLLYGWAHGTLQESISNGRLNGWALKHHVQMAERLLTALQYMHKKEFLHCDLRPANIMYIGDAKDPRRYYVTDYGSFGREARQVPPGSRDNPMGTALHRHRSSPFYSNERRSGSESEEADTAVFIADHKGDVPSVIVVLGWRSDLLNKTGMKADIEREARQCLGQQRSGASVADGSILMSGDTIRIREFVFDVREAVRRGKRYVLRCAIPFWIVAHDRFLVPSGSKATDLPPWIQIPKVVELHQWSAATDLSSVGAIALYTVFRSVSTGDILAACEKRDKEMRGNTDADFIEMMDILESESYLRDVWGRVESVRAVIESVFVRHQELASDGVVGMRLRDLLGTRQADLVATTGASPDSKVYEYLREQVSYFTRTAPGVFWMFVGCGCNLAHFIYFVHFVLQCLHRESSLPAAERKSGGHRPFCADRVAPAAKGEEVPASKAVEAIAGVLEQIGDKIFAGLICPMNPDQDQSSFDLFSYNAAESEFNVRMNNIAYRTLLSLLFRERAQIDAVPPIARWWRRRGASKMILRELARSIGRRPFSEWSSSSNDGGDMSAAAGGE